MPDAPTKYPDILLDQAEDGYCETTGWVEAIVTEDEARDALAEFCCDEDGKDPFRPTGPAQRVHMRLVNPAEDYEYQRWVRCRPKAKTAVEFWEVIVA